MTINVCICPIAGVLREEQFVRRGFETRPRQIFFLFFIVLVFHSSLSLNENLDGGNGLVAQQ